MRTELLADTEELQKTLESLLDLRFGAGAGRIVELQSRPSNYHSSFAIEELDVKLGDGSNLQLVFKDLSPGALLKDALRAKPEFLYDPEREIETYRRVLAPNNLGPNFFGSRVERETGRYWLFLEKVPGLELYQVGDFGVWCEAARWLATMHSRFDGDVERFEREIPLLKYDEDFYGLWIRRAQTFLTSPAQPQDVKEKINWIAERYDRVIENLIGLPKTFLHGEFYASNILVQETTEGWRVCPVDWEMAAAGTGLMDLSALVAGKWTEEEKTLMARAYFEKLSPECNPFSSAEDFFRALDFCRLQIAVQWLGWFGRRRAYSAHTHDWLSEAVSLAERLMS